MSSLVIAASVGNYPVDVPTYRNVDMDRIANATTELRDCEITISIEAGLKEYALFDSQDPGDHVVCAIFVAMYRVFIEDRELLLRR